VVAAGGRACPLFTPPKNKYLIFALQQSKTKAKPSAKNSPFVQLT
jgi:hypothetical protein